MYVNALAADPTSVDPQVGGQDSTQAGAVPVADTAPPQGDDRCAPGAPKAVAKREPKAGNDAVVVDVFVGQSSVNDRDDVVFKPAGKKDGLYALSGTKVLALKGLIEGICNGISI